jgi:hypothetical protein
MGIVVSNRDPCLKRNLGARARGANRKTHSEREKDRNAEGLGVVKQTAASHKRYVALLRVQVLGVTKKGPAFGPQNP